MLRLQWRCHILRTVRQFSVDSLLLTPTETNVSSLCFWEQDSFDCRTVFYSSGVRSLLLTICMDAPESPINFLSS